MFIIAASASTVALILWICVAAAGFDYKASSVKARILNREYCTDYTTADVFYASDVIDTIRELDRNRVEVNGDVMRK
jgi:hypothetical protein